MKYENIEKNVKIIADKIEIGKQVTLGNNIDIKLKGKFSIGDFSVLGSNTQIRGHNVEFGKHLFNSNGLRIGGGGRQHPDANFKLGDRCTIHNNFINVCEPVTLGDDVGLSPETSILTHGYWLSVLDGYPATFAGVKIGNGVIIGYRSIVMMGVEITDNCVIGAQSCITKSMMKKGIYAGVPAKFIKEILPLTIDEKIKKTNYIISEYLKIAAYHGLSPNIELDYPKLRIEEFEIDVESFEYAGQESITTDDFRDYVRKWGIRIYTERPFRSNFSFEK